MGNSYICTGSFIEVATVRFVFGSSIQNIYGKIMPTKCYNAISNYFFSCSYHHSYLSSFLNSFPIVKFCY
jgi:hypothetical protein